MRYVIMHYMLERAREKEFSAMGSLLPELVSAGPASPPLPPCCASLTRTTSGLHLAVHQLDPNTGAWTYGAGNATSIDEQFVRTLMISLISSSK